MSDATPQRIRNLLAQLQGASWVESNRTLTELEHMAEACQFPSEAVAEIIEASARPYPKSEDPNEWDLQIEARLLGLAAQFARPEHVAVLTRVTGSLESTAQMAALTCLAKIGTPEAAEFFRAQLRQASSADTMVRTDLMALEAVPFAPDVLLEPIMHLRALGGDFGHQATLVLHSFLAKGVAGPDDISRHAPALMTSYRRAYSELASRQQASGIGWMWEDAYRDHRPEAGLLLDVFGYLSGDDGASEITSAYCLNDPKLLYFAAISALRRGLEVPTDLWTRVAAGAEVRSHLFDTLAQLGRSELFPRMYRSQEALAEAEMVTWLVFPTELDRVPDAIECVGRIGSAHQGQLFDTYLFRFRTDPPHWAAESGWMVGWAGSFERRQELTITSHGLTFSQFEKWDDQPPEAHLNDLRSQLEAEGHDVDARYSIGEAGAQ